MEEDLVQTGDSEEENLRAMEKDIDEFLSSIRENVSKSTDPENEVTCSEVHGEYDPISSDDCFENDTSPSKNNKPLIEGHIRKLSHSTLKKENKMKKGNVKNSKDYKQNFSHEEHYKHNGRKFGQSPEDEYHYDHSFHPSWRDTYDSHRSVSPRDEYHEDGLPLRSGYDHSISSYKEHEHQEGGSVPQNRKGIHHNQTRYIPRGRCKYRQGFYLEKGEPSQDSHSVNDINFHRKRTIFSRSGSSDEDTVSERSLNSNSPLEWSERYDFDSDFDDQDGDPAWQQEDYPYIEDDKDGHNSTSLIIACLQKAIAYNPDIATKVTQACIALLNEPSDGPTESDYEDDRDSWAAHDDMAGRVSLHSWRNSRSPSFSESPGASSSRSGFRYHSDRFHGHSKRRILERSLSPFDKQARRDKYDYQDRHRKARYSPEHKRKNDTRPSTAASKTQRGRRRSSSEHAKIHYEEEFNLKGAVSWSIRKIRKQCEEESNSTVRRALLSLLQVHERECKMYLKKPEAHPDHEKEYREFVAQKTKSIIDLGGDPNGYNFEQDWKKYWPVQMYKHFQESWKAKMQKCTSLLQKKYGSYSKSSHSSSKKSSVKDPYEKKLRRLIRSNEAVNIKKITKRVKTSKITHELMEEAYSNSEEQQNSETDSSLLHKKEEEINSEIFSILKLLNHIKHRFNDCEASFDELFVKAMSLKEDSFAINDILQSDLPLLEKIDKKLQETLGDVNLTLIQKAVIQETHERFRSFLKKSKEINSHSKKIQEVKVIKKFMESMETPMKHSRREHKIPCLLTNSCSSVGLPKCSENVTAPLYTSCSYTGTSQQLSQPRGTLTEISLVGSPGPESRAPYTPEDLNATTFLLSENQDEMQYNIDASSENVIVGKKSSQQRTLTEICLVGPSCLSSNINKSNVLSITKDSDVTHPPPPGVTPPPSGVTPPPPGVTPPPPGVTPPPPVVTSLLPGATSPPPGVTSSPLCVTSLPHPATLQPSSVTHPLGESLPPSRVPSQLLDVIPSTTASLSPSIIPPSPGITASQSVIMSSCRASAPHSDTRLPQCIIPAIAITSSPDNVNPQLSSSSSDIILASHRARPSPDESLSPVGSGYPSSDFTLLQAQALDSSSCPQLSSVPANQADDDETHMGSQHLSTEFTSSEQSCKPLVYKVAGMASVTDTPPQPSKEFLRSTIKDCFLSPSLPKESNIMSTKQGLLTLETSNEDSSIASVPSLPEDVLKMFEVKPEDIDKVNCGDKGQVNDTIGSSNIKPNAKKPIKITIPQFSKQKSLPKLNPIIDEQELL